MDSTVSDYACHDFCAAVHVSLASLGGNFEQISYSDAFTAWALKSTDAHINNLFDAWGFRNAGGISADDVEITGLTLDMEVEEYEGSGIETTTSSLTVTTGDYTSVTGGTWTTGEPVMSYQFCQTLYFPILWLLETMFPSIFSFCPIFEDHFCSVFEDHGACWQTYCEKTCSGDGRPDVDYLGDDDEGTESNFSQKRFFYKKKT